VFLTHHVGYIAAATRLNVGENTWGRTMKKTVSFLLWVLVASYAHSQKLPIAAFAHPVFGSGKGNSCSAKTASYTLAPDARAISVLRSDRFLDVGQGKEKKARADCKFDLVFTRPLTNPESVHVDLRGGEFKDTKVRLYYTFSIGKQKHSFEYSEGRILEGADVSFARRFELADLPAGTKKIRVHLKGHAETKAANSVGWVAIDSLDACLVDVAKAGGCGSTETPQPQR
jgi:hypothetical protein